MSTDIGKVAAHWNRTRPDLENLFYGSPHLRPYLYECLTGKPPDHELPADWVERWVVEEFLGDSRPVRNCISLCCGFGQVERTLAAIGAFDFCLGVDLAYDAVREASVAAAGEEGHRLVYACVDVDRMRLAPESADLVWANGALHHLTRLEHVLSEAYSALRPGGMLVANEYVGPPHQQLPFRQREIVNSVIHLIPRDLRGQSEEAFIPTHFRRPLWRRAFYQLTGQRLTSGPGWSRWKLAAVQINNAYSDLLGRFRRRSFRYGKLWDVDPWYFERVDPSEGARSDEIVPIIQQTFDESEVRYYNGSILLHALDPTFYSKLDTTRADHRAVLDIVVEIEKSAIQSGQVGRDHAVIVARKQSGVSVGS